MVWITDKDMSKFRDQARALVQELNSNEQVLVSTLKKDIQDCNDTLEHVQFMHDRTVDNYVYQLNEAVEEMHVSTNCCIFNSLIF